MTRPEPSLLRFTLGQRWLHRTLAVLVGVLLATAAILVIGPLSVLVGRRADVARIHVWSGYLLPVPVLVALLRSAATRRDFRLLSRFAPDDWRWLRDRRRRTGHLAVGKFNAGQKLNAAFTFGMIPIMLVTGLIMHFTGLPTDAYRTGATLVHDWFALATFVIVLGHLSFAYRDPEARRGMRTGAVPVSWARREHGRWAEDERPQE